jgi:EAL domain-containing protein (putative c-di-GMP-specific phosphodiesterase class I)
LKIDIEFVRDLVGSSADQHVVKAIVNLAQGFGCQTVAEGVEDAEVLARLQDYGVDFAQGYYLGRPVPLEDR